MFPFLPWAHLLPRPAYIHGDAGVHYGHVDYDADYDVEYRDLRVRADYDVDVSGGDGDCNPSLVQALGLPRVVSRRHQ